MAAFDQQGVGMAADITRAAAQQYSHLDPSGGRRGGRAYRVRALVSKVRTRLRKTAAGWDSGGFLVLMTMVSALFAVQARPLGLLTLPTPYRSDGIG